MEFAVIPSHLWGKMKTFKRISASLLLAAGGLCSVPAHAATTTFVVNTLAAGAADSNVGDGLCQTAASECSLRAALQEANALPASVGDDVRIEFAATLSGDIVHNGATDRMHTGNLGLRPDVIGVGAFLLVDAQRPVTIDFGDRVGAVQKDDFAYAMFYIASSDVVIENFQNAARRDVEGTGGYDDTAGIEGAEAAFAIAGSRVTIRNGLTSDPGTTSMETCVALLDGASNIVIDNYYCRSPFRFGVFVDQQAQVSNIQISRWESQGIQDWGDIWVWEGQGGASGIKTTVNGMTITNSEFRSRRDQGTDYTIGILQNAVVNNLIITNSRFVGADTYGIGIYPTAVTNGLIVQNSTATGTSQLVRDDGRTLQTGMTIRNNILTSLFDDAIILNSPHQDAMIENNQFLDLRGAGNISGITVQPIASGTNNVIRGNTFDQGAGDTNRFAIWMRAGSNRDAPTGWTIANNAVRNIFGSAFGPIFNEGDGNTLISGNTFGEGTRGAMLGDPAPENDDSFFVVNADGFSNNKIQTWRPTGAVFSGTTITVAVAPVADADVRPGNTQPTAPVFIDVYYTATDKAETYLGRIPGVHSTETVFEFTSTATGGAVRAQITDAAGRSSQYSAAQEVVQGLDGGADDDMDGLPNGAECVINLLGIPLVCPDSDGDGTPNYLDNDDDNDGIPTRVECPNGSPCVNSDDDLLPNHLDLDSDADGISDAQECPTQACRDTDGDGAANYIDVDSDGDGLEDAVECPDSAACQDVDANGVEDYLELPAPIDVRGTGGGSMGHLMLALLGGLALLRRRAAVPAALAGLLGLSSVTTAAQAAEDEGWMSRFYGGAKVGALFTDFDEGELTDALRAAGYNLDAASTDSDKLGYGLWVGYALNSYLGLELSYTTGADERVSYSGAAVADLQEVLDVAAPYLEGYGDTYLVRLRYHHALNDRWFLSPHVGVGITQTRESVDSRDRTARLKEDSFTWAVGGGLHYALTRDWSIGVGADYYQASSDNAYSMISGIVEWRFPRALPAKQHQVSPIEPAPVQVVPVDASAAPVGAELEIVSFDLDSAVLTAASREKLDRAIPLIREALQRDAALRVEIAGHTESSGPEAHNASLSQVRATAVLDYLVSVGIPAERLAASGYGLSQPRASNETEAGRSQNRRAELKIAGV